MQAASVVLVLCAGAALEDAVFGGHALVFQETEGLAQVLLVVIIIVF